MKHRVLAISLWVLLTLFLLPGSDLAFAKGKLSIGIEKVKISESVKKIVNRLGHGKDLSLERVAESMGQQLIDRMHNTRKFKVIARSDLGSILKEQDVQRLFSDPSDSSVAQAFKMAGCKYTLIVSIDDFQDLEKVLHGKDGRELARKRRVRLSSVAKIYDTTTMALLETANFQLTNKGGEKKFKGVHADGASSDELYTAMAKQMAHQIAQRVVDILFPAKIIALTGKTATINRGDTTGIAKGQIWDVYALGEKMIDPDTGEDLGASEVNVGQLKITRVTPKFSMGVIVQDYGIDKGHVVRPAEAD